MKTDEKKLAIDILYNKNNLVRRIDPTLFSTNWYWLTEDDLTLSVFALFDTKPKGKISWVFLLWSGLNWLVFVVVIFCFHFIEISTDLFFSSVLYIDKWTQFLNFSRRQRMPYVCVFINHVLVIPYEKKRISIYIFYVCFS